MMASNPPPHTDKPDGMPGGRAALPPGSLPQPYFGPQGDEQRQPPPNAPSPVEPAPVIEDELPPAPLPPDAGR
jgi:hypothetical protein